MKHKKIKNNINTDIYKNTIGGNTNNINKNIP